MPYVSDERFNEDQYLRSFLYGPAKTKKTWWLCRCAELGFNVILLDGDDGAQIAKQLPKEAQAKILAVKLSAKNEKTLFAGFMAQFLRANWSFWWDEDARSTVLKPNPAHSNIRFDASKLTANDVIGLDSWTALAESALFAYAEENSIDLSQPNALEDDLRKSFGSQNNYLNWVLARLHSLPCQVIVIGHATVYEKWRYDVKPPKLVEQRVQPISSSGPHAKKLAKHFTDVLMFEKIGDTVFKINTGGGKDTDGGSRFFEPRVWGWDELGPDKFFAKLNRKATDEPCEAAIYYAPGAELPATTRPTISPQTLSATKPSSASSSSVIPNNQGPLSKLLIGKGAQA